MTEKTNDPGTMNDLIRRAARKGRWQVTAATRVEHAAMNDLIRRARSRTLHPIRRKETPDAQS